jgi:hypothetical protein
MVSRSARRLAAGSIAIVCLCTTVAANARELFADPFTYESVVRSLRAGDELALDSGVYSEGLSLHGMQGTPEQPIRIRGARAAVPTVFVGRTGRSTVSLSNTAHIHISDIIIDGRNLDADGVKAEPGKQCASVHHIVLENLLIVGLGLHQQAVGISSLCPAWGWVIRGNIVVGAGTGLYLGQPDGTAPFVGALIERNVIFDTLGYNMQIKHQIRRATEVDMPVDRMRTVIRHNVFSKSRNASQEKDARPNVLLGHFPARGPGSEDVYEVAANLFFCNPTESLLQAEGNVSIVGNLFVNGGGDAISLQPHHDVPKSVTVDANFVTASGRGVSILNGSPLHTQAVSGNRIFSPVPLEGGEQHGNQVGGFPASSMALSEWVQGNAGPSLDPEGVSTLLRSAEALCSSDTHGYAPHLAQHPACLYANVLPGLVRSPARRRSAPSDLHEASACPSSIP